jgi:Ca-activated chloride channel family protein
MFLPVFKNPAVLLAVLFVPPIIWWSFRRGAGALSFSDTAALGRLPRGKGNRVRRGSLWLRAIGLALLVVALAGPRWPDPGTRIPTQGIAIAMVVDTSGSMSTPDFILDKQPVSRLEAVKRAFRLFVQGGTLPTGERLEGRPQDLISLVTFATRPETACPLTLDHDVLVQILDAQQPHTLTTEATTNAGDALAWAINSLQKANVKRKVLIFLSDGEHNVPPPALKPRQAAQLAGNLKILIHAISAGGNTEDNPSEDMIRARKSMQDLANITGGQYFHASDSESLFKTCADIDRLERQEIESFRYRRYYEGFPWFCLASLMTLATLHALECTAWRKVP